MKLLKRLVTPLVAMVFISMFMAFPIFPAAAQEWPRLEVRPGVIVPGAGGDVAIEIWVTNVAEELEITGFQFSVPFNTQWLAPAPREAGTFMEAFVNDGELLTKPNPYYTVVSDIPYKLNWKVTKAMVMLMPDPWGKYWGPFPSGEGRLLTLHYTASKSNVCMPIDIIDITILNQNVEEVPYETPLSGYYINGVLNVELCAWKFKVNGKAGVGLGHKSTVGKVNTFEVNVTNTGTIDVDVQATFDIISEMAGANVASDIVFLPVGQWTVLSATWTASVPGHYAITGTVHYGLLHDPQFSTRTQILRIDVKPQ